jgi:signal transduction histidine kinase
MSATHRVSNGQTGVARRPLRVLLVEDSNNDAVLMLRALDRGGFDPVSERVDTAAAMDSALHRRQWDIILADHSMPQFSAPEALQLLKQKDLDLPFIIVSGHIDEETAVAAMKAGAHDYIMKDRLARLVPAVERELRDAEVRRARRKSEEALRRAHEELELRVEQRTAALKAANLKLQNVLEERRRLENELLEIAENERRRIGFDLHDDLGQKLTGVSLMVKGLEQKLHSQQHPCAAEAHRIFELIDQVIRHTHNLARQFSSLDVRGDDLTSVLKDLAANVQKMFSIPCVFTAKGGLTPLPPNTSTQLYKIAQEAVSNAIKHGKAAHVSLCLANNSGKLVLTIKNDGVPFSTPATAKNRMGLRIMNYRANTIGATFEIKPQQRNGTVVTCTMSLKNGVRNGRHEPPSGADASPKNRVAKPKLEAVVSEEMA